MSDGIFRDRSGKRPNEVSLEDACHDGADETERHAYRCDVQCGRPIHVRRQVHGSTSYLNEEEASRSIMSWEGPTLASKAAAGSV
jgi:hypothetical protein